MKSPTSGTWAFHPKRPISVKPPMSRRRAEDAVAVRVRGVLVGGDLVFGDRVDQARSEQRRSLALLEHVGLLRVVLLAPLDPCRTQLADDLAAGQVGERPLAAVVLAEARDVELESARAAEHGILVAGAARIGVHLRRADPVLLVEIAVEEFATAQPFGQLLGAERPGGAAQFSDTGHLGQCRGAQQCRGHETEDRPVGECRHQRCSRKAMMSS
jgi:hypothetical protein